MPVYGSGDIRAAVETSVGASAVQIAPARARTALIVQNLGAANVRIGTSGVTATTGMRIKSDQTVTFTAEDCPQGAVFAISESGTNTVLAQEIR